jgi:D-alanyl-D-alanine carboxypeptidase/D-alanyl-D-alanine-endopeptidase (penicillin-binding protein 4)
MTMKSGYIGGTRSYAGYIMLKDSTKVSFSFIVNSFSGKPRSVKEKMFKVLDVLKP